MRWTIEYTKKASASFIMQKDASLLENLSSPILHLYEWANDAATYGYFTKPEQFINLERAKELKLDLAKRPTGGGIVFHICDLAFSVLIPTGHPKFSLNTLENYALINESVIQVIRKLHKGPLSLLPEELSPLDLSCKQFCMAKPTKYDVMIHGKKIGGASQRRTKLGLLHQGTIAIALLPTTYLEKVLLPGTQVIEAMHQNSASLLGTNWTKKDLEEMRSTVQQLLAQTVAEALE